MAEEHTSEGRFPGCDVEKSGAKKLFRHDDSVPEVQKVPRFRPINRNQMFFHPMDIEGLVPEDHEVRAIWDFVGSLDLSRYYEVSILLKARRAPPPSIPVSLSASGSMPTARG